jgi:prepilin-type N-terminal cleavage/methylation domain-containing protein
MKKGFTLIEILLVVLTVSLLMVATGGILFGIFNSKSKNEALDKISQGGNFVVNEIRKNVINANGNGENGGIFSCPVGTYGNSITFVNVKDNVRTTILCFDSGTDGYKIASISGKSVGTTVVLFQKNSDLQLGSCANFVTCSTLPSLQLSNIKFNFNLGAGSAGLSSGTTKSFSLDVTLRN